MKRIANFCLPVTLSLFSLMLLTSCGDMIQELKLNPDGSGTLETSFDVGDLMSMTKGFQDMGTDDTTYTDDTIPDSLSIKPDTIKDPMQALIEKVTDPSYDKDFDTTMTFLSIMPDSIKAKETRLDLAQQLGIRLVSPAKSANLTIGLVANFKNAQNLKELVHYMEKLDEQSQMVASAGPVGLQTKSFLVFDADYKAGWIRIDTMQYGDMAMEFGMSGDSTSTDENLGMMEMMFGNSKIKTIIHVPGEVTSCSNPAAIITKDNRVLLEADFLDVIHKGKMDGFTIHFQPKK
jgi:hypothetical protein